MGYEEQFTGISDHAVVLFYRTVMTCLYGEAVRAMRDLAHRGIALHIEDWSTVADRIEINAPKGRTASVTRTAGGVQVAFRGFPHGKAPPDDLIVMEGEAADVAARRWMQGIVARLGAP